MNKTVAIKVSQAVYQWLCELSGEMQAESGRKVSMDMALRLIKERKSKKLSDFAGAWKMNDKEEDEFLKTLKRGWASWKSSA